MIHTLTSQLRQSTPRPRPAVFLHPRALHAGAPAARGISPLGSESGFGLVEVMISALIVGLIVVATFTGFDVANRTTASERSRAQADALAQQAEDQLRGAPLSTLEALESKPRTETVTQNGTTYTITSTAQYVSDATATASCSSTATSANYLRTTSTATWPSLGSRKPVVETSIISPPPGSALIVQVTDASSAGVAGANATATGPSPAATAHTLETAASGCAILALPPGEYKVNVSKTGYVDENWHSSSEADPSSTHSVYLTAETAIKEPYRFAPAGTLEVKFTGSAPAEGDSFVAFNSLMTPPSFKQIGTPETYKTTVASSATVFPFAGEAKYTVYAGTCEADNPVVVNPENSKPPVVSVPAGGNATTTVTQPPINIKVMSGKSKASPGKAIENALVTLTDEGCGGVKHASKTNSKGALPRPGAPFGEYALCVTGGVSGGNNGATKGLAKERKYTTSFENDTRTGPSELATMTNGKEVIEGAAVIYMESGALTEPGKLETGSSCP